MWPVFGLIWDVISKVSWKVWLAVIIIITIILLGTVVHFKNATIQKQAQQITALNAAINQEKTEIVKYKAAIDSQNNQITAFEDTTKKNEATIHGLTETLTALQTAQDVKISELKNASTPKSCDEAMGYLRNNLKELSW